MEISQAQNGRSATGHILYPGVFSLPCRRGFMLQALVGGSLLILTVLVLLRQHLQSSSASHLQRVESLAGLKASLSQTIKEELGRRKSYHPYLPTIYIITPTFQRQEQIPELTRLAQTLMNVPSIHWIIADDSNVTNQQVVDYLDYSGIPHTYLLTPMPHKYKVGKVKPKGVANRNGGLQWVREHATKGVIYFADDDNTYDIRVFQEMRYTKRVSMWPVGLVTGAGISTPVLKKGEFYSWYDGWIANRKFPVDMAGFAVSVQYLLQIPNAKMPYIPGYEEDGFLKSLSIKPEEIEFKADDCTKVYVWHTQTKKNSLSNRDILKSEYDNTNLRILQKSMMIKT